MIKVAVGILFDYGNVLICQRKSSARYPLKWEFPGGKVEEGESPTDCLKRELKEELGLDVDVGPLYHRQEHAYSDNGTFEVFYHVIASYRGDLENRAFESIQWCPRDRLEYIDMLEGNREVVVKLANESGAPI
jgi:8-oxo-dGTP diphosphatase